MDAKKAKEIPEALLRLTVDQMRTLILLNELKSSRVVGHHLFRDQSSIQKQIETVNKIFNDYCGVKIVDEPSRRTVREHRSNKQLAEFTDSGKEILHIFNEFLDKLEAKTDKIRRDCGKNIIAAVTNRALPILEKVWDKWKENVDSSFNLKIEHIDTSELQEKLRSERVDLVLSSRVEHSNMLVNYEDFEYIEWSKEEVVILTNQNNLPEILPLKNILNRDIRLILPQDGAIVGFIKVLLDIKDFQELNVVATYKDGNFGCRLLKQGVYKACMFIGEGIAKEICENDPNDKKFFIKRLDGADKMPISVGLYRRRGAEQYDLNHPLNICWKIFQEEVDKANNCKKLQSSAYCG